MKDVGEGRLAHEVTMIEALPAGTNVIGNVEISSYTGLTYKGEQSITMNGASQAATLPSGTNFVMIAAEGGDVRFTINAAASATSGGYVPENLHNFIIKLANLASLAVFGESPAVAHLIYFQEP